MIRRVLSSPFSFSPSLPTPSSSSPSLCLTPTLPLLSLLCHTYSYSSLHTLAHSHIPFASSLSFSPVPIFLSYSHPSASSSHSLSFPSSLLPLPSPLPPHRSLFIQSLPTPNPLAMKFLPGKSVLPSSYSPIEFTTLRSSAISPLASSLLKIDGVHSVLLGSDFISVVLKSSFEWSIVKPSVFACIMEFYSSGQPVIIEGKDEKDMEEKIRESNPNAILPTDSEVVSMIKELIETGIRPTVQQDGGDLHFIRFDDTTGIVYVEMKGSCVGCSSSAVTLKNGIENMLMHYVTEVKGVKEIGGEGEGGSGGSKLQQVSEEELRKLEEKLRNATKEEKEEEESKVKKLLKEINSKKEK